MRHTNGIGLLFLLPLVILAACRGEQMSPQPQDLPDLNALAKPYTTVETTRVRTGPGPQFRAIGEIPANARVHVVGRDGDWLLVVSKTGNAPGYIQIALVRPVSASDKEALPAVAGPYETVADTQVRSGPGLHYPVMSQITKGTKLNVVGEETGWLRVESKRGNPPGYVDQNLARPVQN
jgi:uncharacterized protein YgiM (DUF1202 family)